MKRTSTHTWRKLFFSLPLAVLIWALLSSTGTLAQGPKPGKDSWQFGLSIYGWFPDLSGETSFTQPGGTTDFKIDIEDILENLEFTFMGMFDVRKGRYGLVTDVIYLDVANSNSGTREGTIGGTPLPVNAAADVNLELDTWVWTLAGYYRAYQQSGLTADVLVGMRYVNVTQKLDWNITGNVASIPVPDRTGSATVDVTNWDAIVGVRGRYAIGPKDAWFVPLYIDFGTGGSDLTWQGMAGLGYSFRWIELTAVWRYLYYNFSSDKAIRDINFSGPAVGVTFKW